MKRGEIWTLRDKNYASKARPVVVIQSNQYNNTFDSVILCLFTTYDSSDISTRVFVEPSKENGLEKPSYVMTDKIITVDKRLLKEPIGLLSEGDMNNISKQLKVILDL